MMKWIPAMHAKMIRKLALGLGGLALLPTLALATPPEISCQSLSDGEQQKFYDLSGRAGEAAHRGDLDAGLALSLQAMQMCTSDAYTEYNLARIYQQRNECPRAYFHFERLEARLSEIAEEDKDLADAITKNFRDVRKNCGDVVSLEIVCVTPGTMITLAGYADKPISCPVYSKIKPGAYSMIATKDGFHPYKDTLTVSADGIFFKIPELRDANDIGELRVRCPRGSSKFIMTNPHGVSEEFLCPWQGKVASGDYRIRLGNSDPSNDIVVTVTKHGQIDHLIPVPSKSRCSITPLEGAQPSTGLAAVAMGLLASLGWLTMRRRRNNVVS
ncbi:MAG: hypothetical protein FWC40_09525 [Proteobacteria bacterium]|nr:hypothetical protein [Pseudomonadota bacterium]